MPRFSLLYAALSPFALFADTEEIQLDPVAQQEQASYEIDKQPAGDHPPLSEYTRPGRVRARHMFSGGIGYNLGYTSLDLLFSTSNVIRPEMPFIDFRTHVFDDARMAVNVGGGWRYLGVSRVWGINVYYDYRQAPHHEYQQIGAGLETLGEYWDFRINGYLPFGSHKVKYGNPSVLHFAMKGINAEFGIRYEVHEVTVHVAGGPYFLANYNTKVWGGEARLYLDITEYLRIDGQVSHDGAFGSRSQAQISVNIPFGPRYAFADKRCPREPWLRKLGMQPVERFEIIVIDKK